MADIVRARYVYTWFSQGQFARIWEWSDISCFLKIVKIPRIRYYLFDFLILDVSSALNPSQSLRDLTPIRSYVHSMFFESHALFPRQTVENIVRFLFLFLIKVSFITKNKVDPIIIFIYPLRLLRAIRVNGENRCGQFGTKVVTEWRIGGGGRVTKRRLSCKGLSGGSDRMSLPLNFIRLPSKLATVPTCWTWFIAYWNIWREISRNCLSLKRACLWKSKTRLWSRLCIVFKAWKIFVACVKVFRRVIWGNMNSAWKIGPFSFLLENAWTIVEGCRVSVWCRQSAVWDRSMIRSERFETK